MRQPATDIPVILARQHPSGGRIVYFAADIDRAFARRGLPDHARLLTNAITWAAHGRFPFTIEGPGYLDCHLYRQEDRLIFHLVNLTGANQWPGYVQEHTPVGPLTITLPAPASGTWCIHQVNANTRRTTRPSRGRLRFTIDRLEAHELVILSRS